MTLQACYTFSCFVTVILDLEHWKLLDSGTQDLFS